MHGLPLTPCWEWVKNIKIEHGCEIMCEAAQIIHVGMILEMKCLWSAGPVDVECRASSTKKKGAEDSVMRSQERRHMG